MLDLVEFDGNPSKVDPISIHQRKQPGLLPAQESSEKSSDLELLA
jgi:hypothetical protein